MSTRENHVPERIAHWVAAWLSSERLTKKTEIVPLVGDGSVRGFYRLVMPDQTWILLSDPGWVFSKDYAAHQAYLKKAGLPVPEFRHVDPTAGLLVMEDLGDELLQSRMKREPANKTAWLERATTLLAKLHGATFPVPADLPAATRRFDTRKYLDELLFTGEHLVWQFLKLERPTERHRAVLFRFCESLDATRPEVFAHRDYHTRNLMVRGTDLFMIDFQDARLGPVHYDLASILYDAYQPLSDDERKRLVTVYHDRLRLFPLHEKISWATFDEDLSRVAFQRTVKAAGSFASFFTRFSKTTHLSYLIPALESALRLQRTCFPASDEIFEILDIKRWIEASRKRLSEISPPVV